SLTPPPREVVDAGTAVALAARPGVAPVVRASLTVHERVEAGLRYGGRDVGASVRWVFFESRDRTSGARTLSVGFEGKALLLDQQARETPLPGFRTADGVHGY